MSNKKIVTLILTVIFIGAAGILYSLGASKDTDSNVVLKENDDERALIQDKSVTNLNEDVSEEKIQNNAGDTNCIEEDSLDTVIDKSSVNESNENVTTAVGVQENNNNVTTAADTQETDSKNLIYVHICGEVKNPNVYQVQDGTRIVDVIKLAGGLTKMAAGDYINQAQTVTDGEKIYVPSIEEVKDVDLMNNDTFIGNASDNDNIMKDKDESTVNSTSSTRININTASFEELLTLTGIGEAKANSIIEYREANGAFKSIDELKNIEGIKDGVFNKIRDLITIN